MCCFTTIHKDCMYKIIREEFLSVQSVNCPKCKEQLSDQYLQEIASAHMTDLNEEYI